MNVTDHAGAHALAHATLRVSSAPGTSGTSGLTTWEWGLIAGLVVLAFLLLLFFLLYRRRRKEPKPNAGAPGSGPLPPPVPPGRIELIIGSSCRLLTRCNIRRLGTPDRCLR